MTLKEPERAIGLLKGKNPGSYTASFPSISSARSGCDLFFIAATKRREPGMLPTSSGGHASAVDVRFSSHLGSENLLQ